MGELAPFRTPFSSAALRRNQRRGADLPLTPVSHISRVHSFSRPPDPALASMGALRAICLGTGAGRLRADRHMVRRRCGPIGMAARVAQGRLGGDALREGACWSRWVRESATFIHRSRCVHSTSHAAGRGADACANKAQHSYGHDRTPEHWMAPSGRDLPESAPSAQTEGLTLRL
jgi:hypothetical protein